MSIKKVVLFSVLSTMVAIASGCSKDNGQPFKPDFDDKSPPTPVADIQSQLPEPMALSKGSAQQAIEHSLILAGDDFNINEELRLKSLLTGYNGFNEYALDSQVRGASKVNKLYASQGQYNAVKNKFIIQGKDINELSKKNLVI